MASLNADADKGVDLVVLRHQVGAHERQFHRRIRYHPTGHALPAGADERALLTDEARWATLDKDSRGHGPTH